MYIAKFEIYIAKFAIYISNFAIRNSLRTKKKTPKNGGSLHLYNKVEIICAYLPLPMTFEMSMIMPPLPLMI